ncbi:hypothetical protein HPB52_019620 [Rhipicephalus sanguineus]|uniref:Fibronectin type-III domain-containing protein n=1 Tax=Rhipicephalus sanguineus TaxID=34632 RepID=A0A9D4PGV6_RHISA|nr:hypothetical protein HPB52_019620 [Rhipicephalus sanguineus]
MTLPVPTEVTNLKLGAVEADTFVLTWERPKACFDYYTVEVVDETSRGRSSVKCNKGVPINPSQTSVTCDQIESCANVTIRVRTHTTGPPERYSTAPEGFCLSLAYLDFTSVDVLIDMSNVSSCQLGSCYAELQHPSMVKEKLQCDVFSETQGTVRLRGLTTGAPYKCKVSIQSPYSFKQAEKMIDVTAQFGVEELTRDSPVEGKDETHTSATSTSPLSGEYGRTAALG